MERVFQANFADVRVHVGPQPSALGALAFTQGANIYFAPGTYEPATARGLRLLGHELTHVVQQRSGRVANPFGAGRIALVQDPALEAEAERMGLRVTQLATAAPVPARLPPTAIPPALQGCRNPHAATPRAYPLPASGAPRGIVQRAEFPFSTRERPWLGEQFSVSELSEVSPILLGEAEHRYTKTRRKSTLPSRYVMIHSYNEDTPVHVSLYPSNPEKDPLNQEYGQEIDNVEDHEFNQWVSGDERFDGLEFNQFHLTVEQNKNTRQNPHFYFDLSGSLIPQPGEDVEKSLGNQRNAFQTLQSEEQQELERFHGVFLDSLRKAEQQRAREARRRERQRSREARRRKQQELKLNRQYRRLVRRGLETQGRAIGGPPTLAERAARNHLRSKSML